MGMKDPVTANQTRHTSPLAGTPIQGTKGSNGLWLVTYTTGTPPTTADLFSVGCLCLDTTNAKAYINTGTSSVPSWDSLGDIAASEITLANTKILIGGASGVAVAQSMSGDATIAANGAITIAALAISTGKIAANAVTSAKLDETTIQYAEVAIASANIVGSDAGDIAHTAGAELVAAQGADKVIEFISAVAIYDHDTADYTGGGDDCVVRVGTTTLTPAIAKADLLGASGDKVTQAPPLTTADIPLTANENLNFFAGTAFTQPGTAAGVLRVKVAYRVHTLRL